MNYLKKYLASPLILLCIIVINICCNNEYPKYYSEFKKVNLKYSLGNKQLFYETENVQMILDYYYLINDIDNFIRKYEQPEDKELKIKLIKIFSETNLYKYKEIDFGKFISTRFIYRLADILESGNVKLINKSTNAEIPIILIEHYDEVHGSLDGFGGRKFYFVKKILFMEKKVLFFKTIERIS